MGKYDDLFDGGVTTAPAGKYADLFDTGEIPTFEPQVVYAEDVTPEGAQPPTSIAEDIRQRLLAPTPETPFDIREGVQPPEPTSFAQEVQKVLTKPSPAWMQPAEKFLTKPLLHQMSREEATKSLGYDPGPLPEEYLPEGKAKEVVGGLREAGGEFAQSLSSPAMIALMAATGGTGAAGRIAGGAFSAQMAAQTPELWRQFNEAETLRDKTRIVATAVAIIGGGVLGARHALKGGIGIPSRTELPLRTEPLVPEPPPTQGMGPGTIAGDVSRALERRFTLQPEPPPEIAPSVPIEQTLPKIPREPPVFNPELGPSTRQDFQMPLKTETMQLSPAERNGQILERRKGILARKAELTARAANGEQGLEEHLAAVEAELNDPVTNPVVHAPPVESPVRHGEFTKPGYTAVETPPEGPVQAPGGAVPQGMTRVYRGGVKGKEGEWFSTDKDTAEFHQQNAAFDGPARLSYVDIPTEDLVKYQDAASEHPSVLSGRNIVEANDLVLPKELAGSAKTLHELPAERPPPGAGAPEPYTPEAAAARAAAPQKPSKIGQSIEAKAVEAKLTKGFSETAGYDPITIKDQAARASSLVENNPAHARSIVRGEAALPPEVRGTSLITAMEEHLLRNPDPHVAYELANSRLVSLTSEAAQEMRLMSERVPDGITTKFAEIKAAREKGAELRKETPAKIKREITNEVVKQASKRPTWEAFVREIVC